MNNWISVDEKLPANGQTCILYGEGIHLTFFRFWEKGANGNPVSYFLDMNNKVPVSIEEITHWQPLPEPPKQ